MTKLKWFIYLLHAGLFWSCLMLPFKTTLSNIGLIAVIISSAGLILSEGVRTEELKAPAFYLRNTWAFFIPLLIGYLYTAFPEVARAQMVKAAFFALAPILLLAKGISREKAIYWSSWGLIAGATFSALYLKAVNLMEYLNSSLPMVKYWSYDFTGQSFVQPFKDMHPVYYGSYLLFMLVLLWQRRIKLPNWSKILLSTLMLVVLVSVNSRMILLLTILLGLIFLGRKLSSKMLAIGLVITAVVLFLTYPFLKKTYVYNKTVAGSIWDLEDNVGEQNLDGDQRADSRMARWRVAMDLYLEKPVFGHGTGSARIKLVEKFREEKMRVSASQNYDTHNQYLAFGINYGLIGLLFLFGYLGLNYYHALRYNDWLLLAFIIMITGLCMTENYLIRNMGINFVALFGNLLILPKND